MDISLKIVAVMLVCGVIVSEAQRLQDGRGKGIDKPQDRDKVKGGNANPRPTKGPERARPLRIPDGVRRAGRLCGALVSGKITNDNATFDGVFTNVTSVCRDLSAWIEANKTTDDEEALPEGKEKPTDKLIDKFMERFTNKFTAKFTDKFTDKFTTVQILLRVCRGMEKKIPVDNSTIRDDLKPLVDRFDTVCQQAKTLAGPGADV